MVLDKQELISALQHEVRVLLHLLSKIQPEYLNYRPSPKQRSLLELLQYLAILGPIHLRLCLRNTFDMDVVREMWTTEEKRAKTLGMPEATDDIARHAALYEETLSAFTDADMRQTTPMFGSTAARGVWLVRLVLNHYAAYRMQLFLYLKACGRDELDTMNLWAGMDAR